jgi:hypothetical protein
MFLFFAQLLILEPYLLSELFFMVAVVNGEQDLIV